MESTPMSYAVVAYLLGCIGINVICLVVVAYTIIFSYSRPKNRPPGPWLKLPYVGNFYLYLGDTLKNFSDMRKR